jgi:hypothetical protein
MGLSGESKRLILGRRGCSSPAKASGLTPTATQYLAVLTADLGSDVGRAVLMLLRLNDALTASVERVGHLVDQSKQLLKFVFETKVRTWSNLLQKNAELVALVRRLYMRYLELIKHEGWRLRREPAVSNL